MSARAANTSTPRGSVCTATANAGISHGRLSSAAQATTVVATAGDARGAPRRSGAPSRPASRRHSAAGTAASTVMLIAVNPPIAAGSITSSSRAGLIRTGPVHISRSTQGSPA